jgi:hypothetical protein
VKATVLGIVAGLVVTATVRLLATPLATPTYGELQFAVGFDLLPVAVVVIAWVVAVISYRLGGGAAPLAAAVIVAALLVLPEFWGLTICPPVVPGCVRAVPLSPHYPPLALAGLLLPLLTTRLLQPRSAEARR